MKISAIAAAVWSIIAVSVLADEKLPSVEDLEAMGAVIGKIIYAKQNVFDTTQPGENKSIYRLANRWHAITRDSTIRQQLLFKPGDQISKRLIAESERLLRQNVYLYDAKIEPVLLNDGVVDLRVWTRDLWTLMPGFSISRSGGENRLRLSLSERNLLGTGAALRLSYIDDVDRESNSFQFHNRNLGQSWTSLFLEVADKSDGDTIDVRLIKPFYALDTRRSAGGTFFDDTREVSFYDLGNEVAEYAVDTDLYRSFVGWSSGLRDGWVQRWSAGIVHDESRFSPVENGSLPSLLPADRKLVYPFAGFELLQNKFESTSNRDQIDRTEDFYLGKRLSAMAGFASEGAGSDRESLIYRLDASRGFGSMGKRSLILSSTISGRVDEGNPANTEFLLNARYYSQMSGKRLFFMTLDTSLGRNLDLDNLAELGGDSGLRGYPLRYQAGDSKLLFTAEQRYFTDWYPLKLFRVGGAVFADVGRTWGNNPAGGPPIGWLKDVGFGLRLAPTRASGRDIIHIDIAFPLDGDPSIDEVQFLLQSKRSF